MIDTTAGVPTRVFTFFALAVEKAGEPTLILHATEHAVPTFAVGQEVDVAGNVGGFAGTVTSVKTQIDVTRNGTDEIRTYTTTIVLG